MLVRCSVLFPVRHLDHTQQIRRIVEETCNTRLPTVTVVMCIIIYVTPSSHVHDVCRENKYENDGLKQF